MLHTPTSDSGETACQSSKVHLGVGGVVEECGDLGKVASVVILAPSVTDSGHLDTVSFSYSRRGNIMNNLDCKSCVDVCFVPGK